MRDPDPSSPDEVGQAGVSRVGEHSPYVSEQLVPKVEMLMRGWMWMQMPSIVALSG